MGRSSYLHPCETKFSAAFRSVLGELIECFLADIVPRSSQYLHISWNLHCPPPEDPTNLETCGSSSSTVARWIIVFILPNDQGQPTAGAGSCIDRGWRVGITGSIGNTAAPAVGCTALFAAALVGWSLIQGNDLEASSLLRRCRYSLLGRPQRWIWMLYFSASGFRKNRI